MLKANAIKMSQTLIILIEYIGTAAFAVSGALSGIKKGMDIFGVIVLGIVTATGGGVFRDIILNITPPEAFQDLQWIIVAFVISSFVFIVACFEQKLQVKDMSHLLIIMDTLGLGSFTVSGINTAIMQNSQYNNCFLVFIGVITGVGGGTLRDMFSSITPEIFIKDIYAVAAIAGAIIYVDMIPVIGNEYAMVSGFTVIIIIRLLSVHLKWNLPHAYIKKIIVEKTTQNYAEKK